MHDSPTSTESISSPPSSVAWLPLTTRQSLVWADDKVLTENRYHHWALLVRMAGTVEVERLNAAWQQTVQAHDALGLVVDARQPRQRFAAPVQSVRQIDLADGVDIETWTAEHASGPFDRTRPPFDACLVRTATGESAFVLFAHYLVCDELSFHGLIAELSQRYAQEPVAVPEPYVSFLRSRQSTEERAKAQGDTLAWQQLLRDPPPQAAPLGCVHKSNSLAVSRIERPLSDSTARALNRTQPAPGSSAAAQRTFERVLATVVLAWLHRLSGQRDIVIAVPLDGRDPASPTPTGLVSEVGYLRVEFDDNESFATLTAKVDAAYEFARQHSAATSGGVDFVSAYVCVLPRWPQLFCGLPARARLGNAAVWSKAGLGVGDHRDSLSVRLYYAEQGQQIALDFHDETYPASTRERVADYFFRFLDAYLTDPAQRVSGVDILAFEERQTLLRMGRGREPSEAPDLLTAFAARVEEAPDSCAVEFDDCKLSYRALDRVTNRLARRLQAFDVGLEARVAVAMPRGLGELCAILATLKAGATYVPIDPGHPVDRVRVVLEDADPQVLVAPPSSPLREALAGSVRLFELEDPLLEGAEIDDAPLEVGIEPHHLAYILFTSGSTGRPKGVEIPRGAFANFLQSMAAEPGLTAKDRVVAITTTTFDIAGLELFLPLYVGGTVVLADRETAGDPVRLRALFERAHISLMQATPATWRLLLDAGWTGHPGLRMLCGGEAMSLALARRLSACGSELWNVYGPTETTVWSTLDLVPRDVELITVGHAIDHTQLTLRDPAGQLVPLGAIGEICIGGKGLARGYRGRADLTAERFPTDPQTGERFYKTGDLGRYLPDGRLECLGRIDHQVKVRGFRIELADIEAQLRSVAGVNEVLVMARPSGDGDPQLVAYWVGTATRDALHQVAKEKLPHYMVPSAYVHLDVFPLTTSGKIDRKQLPAPEEQGSQDLGMAPRNDRESLVASIWREILGLPFVPIDKDFFSLGGTSVRAIQLRARILDTFGVNLPLKTLFEHPTVQAVVAELDTGTNDDAPVVTWLAKATASGAIPWIGVMGIHLFEDLARALPPGQSLLAMHVPIRYVPGVDEFPTVTEIASKYVDVIRQHQPTGPYYLLGLCHGGVVAFEIAAQLEAANERVALVALLDAELPRARRFLKLERIKHAARDLVADPRAMAARAKRSLEKRSPALQRFLRLKPDSSGAGSDHREPIDMPFDGPEIDADLLAYQALNRRVRCDIVTFRATRGDVPSWIVVEQEQGWSGLARRQYCHDIPASHLGILREPHAAEVVQRLMEARKRASDD